MAIAKTYLEFRDLQENIKPAVAHVTVGFDAAPSRCRPPARPVRIQRRKKSRRSTHCK